MVSLLVLVLPHENQKELVWERGKDATTLRLPSTKISGPKDRYHSLAFSIYVLYQAGVPGAPQTVNFELVSVVKARQLNTDLYVVFVVDGKEIHFSSNRSAIRRPVRGKPWMGERMVFLIPYGEFQKMGDAKTLGVKLGGVAFDFDDKMRVSVHKMAQQLRITPTM